MSGLSLPRGPHPMAALLSNGGVRPPTGFVFLTDSDGAYLTGSDGAYLVEAA